ncbi:hypothetical protein V6N13_033787 [Hibiscus sabdariffa]
MNKGKGLQIDDSRNKAFGEGKGDHMGQCSNNVQAVTRIQGHVDEEALWRFSKCLIGTMATICSTDQRIAEVWGTLEALGENAALVNDCIKVTLLVSTNQIRTINDIVELEVENTCHLIKVMEVGINFSSAKTSQVKNKQSTVVLSLDSSRSKTPISVGRSKDLDSSEDLMAVYMGKDSKDGDGINNKEENRCIGEIEITAEG